MERLHHVLSNKSFADILQWQPHGRAFRIINQTEFESLMGCNANILEGQGFVKFITGTDEGCWYKDGFTRCGIDDACVLPSTQCSEPNNITKKAKMNKKKEDISPEVAQFLSVTDTSDGAMARRYLEMSGQNVEMAVTLFLESGGGFAGFGSPAAASTGVEEVEMEVETEEPDFYTLPYALLPPRQSPAGKVVASALKEYWAFRTIRRALLRWIQNRKVVSMQIEAASRPTLNITKNPQSTCKHGTAHFLMQSLVHPSINVRRTAGRMFLSNLHQVQGMDKTNAIQGLQESLVIMLHQIMFNEAPYGHRGQEQVSISRSSIHQQANEGDPAVQLMGMLTSLVCDGGFSNVLIADKIKSLDGKGSGILCHSQLQELASFSIESFVASGGLRWACGSIIRLVHMLVHGQPDEDSSSEGGSDSDSHQRRKRRWKNGGINNETIQTRLVLLVDLVYRLVLFGSVPYAVDKEGALAVGTTDGDEDKSSLKSAANEDAQQKKKRTHLSHFYDIMSRATRETGESSRTTALRNSIRASLASRAAMSPPLPTTSDKSGSGDGGGEKDKNVSPDVAEENRLRRERRKATLEKVHNVFWSTTIPAAVCVGKNRMHEDSIDTKSEPHYGTFSPLACLVAAYEILRSPSSRFDDATNKAIAILSRLVDPAGGACLVVSDPEIPWGLATVLGEMGAGKTGVIASNRSRKRGRSASHASQDGLPSRSSPSRAQNEVGSHAKRQRTRRTHVSSLLERLSGDRDNPTGASPYSSAAASASSSHYPSLLLRGSVGAGSSAASSANRDGSLSRIIAAAEASNAIRARAVLDRSPGDWRLLDSVVDRDNDDREGEGVVMMEEEEDDNDTEFDQEDGPDDGDIHEEDGDEEGEKHQLSFYKAFNFFLVIHVP